MAKQDRPSNLGRGLAALLGDETEDYTTLDRVRTSKQVPIEFLHPGRLQPRRYFDEESLGALAESIRENGLLQPILVRRNPEQPDTFEIVAGERRWRAAQIAQLHEVPIVIRELSDAETLQLAIIENVQREDLSPLEEADGYRQLMEEFSYTQEALASVIGKSRSHIANTLRLLNLSEPVRELLTEGKLTAGHARALLNAEAPESLAKKVVAKGLSVRETERLANRTKANGGAPKAARTPVEKDPNTVALERDLSALLGLKVSVTFRGSGGELTIHYHTLDQLDDVLHRLHQTPA
ncbi:MAG: ParB/RepB/Spo0J family partition protein [Kiloniellales bacterium]|nr:ParB/RepB/Spo0J family partition protein [Kiloniellales bacterium]MDJ0980662.1 ParB/RepB/Spo0J family partition protein [Kiloniellales bacterium]